MEAYKYCKDCKWSLKVGRDDPLGSNYFCNRPRIPSLITGESTQLKTSCYDERYTTVTGCDTVAKYFEAK